jgi:DNA-binding NtrC family response regulator
MFNLPRILLVEPDGALREDLRRAAGDDAHVDADGDFPRARTDLLSKPYDWVVTNVRLDTYNGLHLLHLAGATGVQVGFLIYADCLDLTVARAAQRAGAFYESRQHLPQVLRQYLRRTLPPQDRRDVNRSDRREIIFRGGRRCTDRRDVTSVPGVGWLALVP